MEFLSNIFEEEILKKIINHEYYDEEKMCSIIPYACDDSLELDEETEAKFYVLANDPLIFFLLGDRVDDVPDLRSISEGTREFLHIDSWQPWKELEREIEILYYIDDRRDNWSIYDRLLKAKDLYSDKKEEFTYFFYTYPIISYLLLLNIESLYAGRLAYPYLELLPRDKNSYKNSLYASDIKTVRFLLEDIDPMVVINERLYGNLFVFEWLVENNANDKLPRDDLLHSITLSDNLSLFLKYEKEESAETWPYYLIKNNSIKIIEYLFDSKDSELYYEHLILYASDPDEWLGYQYPYIDFVQLLTRKYGLKRYYGEYDAFKTALYWGDFDWIKLLPQETLIKYVEYEDKEIHPILYMFHVSPHLNKDLLDYLYEVFQTNPHSIIQEAIAEKLRGGLIEIINFHKAEISKDQLIGYIEETVDEW